MKYKNIEWRELHGCVLVLLKESTSHAPSSVEWLSPFTFTTTATYHLSSCNSLSLSHTRLCSYPFWDPGDPNSKTIGCTLSVRMSLSITTWWKMTSVMAKVCCFCNTLSAPTKIFLKKSLQICILPSHITLKDLHLCLFLCKCYYPLSAGDWGGTQWPTGVQNSSDTNKTLENSSLSLESAFFFTRKELMPQETCWLLNSSQIAMVTRI